MHAIVIFLAQYLILVPLVAVCVVFLQQPTTNAKKRFILEGVVAAVLVLALAKIGSMLFYNPRPFIAGHFAPYFAHGNDNGFPSDHTLLSSFIAMLVWYKNRKLGWLLLCVALVIGLSRVVAGVHHLIDIAGGFAFSIAGVTAGMYLVKQVIARRHATQQ